MMKAPQSLLTHAAVFGAGIALAMVAFRSGPSDSSSASADDAATSSRTRSSRGAGLGDSAADRDRSGGKSRGDVGARAGGTPAEQLSGIVAIGDVLERQTALYAMLNRLGPDEFLAVAEQYREMDHFSDSGGEFDLILRVWAKSNPMAALEYTHDELGSRGRTGVVLSAWAVSDPGAAEAWALEKHEGDGENPYMASVVRGLAAYDLGEASRMTQDMKLGRERARAVDAITHALFMQGAEAAMAYPATIGEEHLRGGFVDMISRRLVGDDPAKAAAWLASFPEGAVQNRSARRVGAALAREDGAAAASWVAKLDPSAQGEAARGVIPVMSSNDIAATARWISQLPADLPNHDRVVEEFVWSCDSRDPVQSAAWIEGVADEGRRQRLYHRMLGGWARRDANAVREWVGSNEVPEDVRRRFSR